jgi:hypothetical protein
MKQVLLSKGLAINDLCSSLLDAPLRDPAPLGDSNTSGAVNCARFLLSVLPESVLGPGS